MNYDGLVAAGMGISEIAEVAEKILGLGPGVSLSLAVVG